MKIRYCTPYSTTKNLAEAYNREMELGGADYIAFVDRDTIWLDPYFGHKIERIIELNGLAYYTCYTNRVACKWQVYPGVDWNNNSMVYHKMMTKKIYDRHINSVEDHTLDSLWSGFLMIIPTSHWIPLEEKKSMLGVDNTIHENAIKLNVPIKLMKSIYIYHDYRGGNRGDKSHLIV